MNIIDTLTFAPKRALLTTEGALSLLGPVAATGLVVSIADVIRDGKAVAHTKYVNSAFAKIKAAVALANKEQKTPKILLDGEETEAMDVVLDAVKRGAITVIETVCEGLFSVIPFVIEAVVVPMFTVVSWSVMAALPLILTPEGLAALGVLGVAGLGGYLYHKWKTKDQSKDIEIRIGGQKPGAAGVSNITEAPVPAGAALGLRNNNPGNLVYAGQPGALPKTGNFAQFPTQGQGLYNLGRQLELYSSRGLNTVDSVIRNFSATDQDAYVANVSAALGVKPHDQIDLSDPKVLNAMMRAIIRQENKNLMPYSDAQMDEAVRQALAFRANQFKDVADASNLIMPVDGVVSSPFGHRDLPIEGATTEHKGVDIAGTAGSSVVAAAAGTVETAGPANGYGNLVQLLHAGLRTRYGHLQSISVKKGDTVVQGQEIGKLGSTGVSTGAHLHFETQPITASSPVDPAQYLPGLGKGQKVAQGAAGNNVNPQIAQSNQAPDLVRRNGQILSLAHS
jgi:murein DD-endopeptidase MepM/ murein hydrolase activator NlpD